MLSKHKANDKHVKCQFFVVPGDGPSSLRMPDIDLLGIIRVICETIDNKTNDIFVTQGQVSQ